MDCLVTVWAKDYRRVPRSETEFHCTTRLGLRPRLVKENRKRSQSFEQHTTLLTTWSNLSIKHPSFSPCIRFRHCILRSNGRVGRLRKTTGFCFPLLAFGCFRYRWLLRYTRQINTPVISYHVRRKKMKSPENFRNANTANWERKRRKQTGALQAGGGRRRRSSTVWQSSGRPSLHTHTYPVLELCLGCGIVYDVTWPDVAGVENHKFFATRRRVWRKSRSQRFTVDQLCTLEWLKQRTRSQHITGMILTEDIKKFSFKDVNICT